MQSHQRILAVIDPTSDNQKALYRAIELSGKTGASVTALLVIYDFSYEMTTMLSADERDLMRKSVINEKQAWLDELLTGCGQAAAQLHGKVVWHNRPYEAVIKEVLNNNHEIVVKATHEHNQFKAVIFTPTDWHLLRKCPVPLLLVKEHEWPCDSKVLAAVHASSDDSEHISLNHKIIKEAVAMADVLGSKPVLANCYPSAAVNLAVEIPEFDPVTYTEAIAKHHQDELDNYSSRYKIPEDDAIIQEGLAEDVIPLLAKQLDAELVVLGTVGRTGISAALIGNTAEHMLDQLNCDVLALKPDGFVCPVDK
ncbi:universal stress protein UspE [Catenovulum sp. SM1970]|uniref:universal stress protein UspE n=1 Tax=Marinifaba aquimaris TaxID=2741323 RepID=UPI001572BABA|nr:universal stress protein UspE [Marinifaba aquimaris]NTS77302.1 universal stress protein UspE [Marinifaba aquimaris]